MKIPSLTLDELCQKVEQAYFEADEINALWSRVAELGKRHVDEKWWIGEEEKFIRVVEKLKTLPDPESASTRKKMRSIFCCCREPFTDREKALDLAADFKDRLNKPHYPVAMYSSTIRSYRRWA